jgi:hypothetical protein
MIKKAEIVFRVPYFVKQNHAIGAPLVFRKFLILFMLQARESLCNNIHKFQKWTSRKDDHRLPQGPGLKTGDNIPDDQAFEDLSGY